MARQKIKLKEKSDSTAKRESFTKLFAPVQNLPMPAPEPTQKSHPQLSKLTSPTELKPKKKSVATAEVTYVSAVGGNDSDKTKTIAQASSKPQDNKAKKKPKQSSVSTGWFLLVPAVSLTVFVLLSPEDRSQQTKMNERPIAEYEKPEFRQNVEFHRKDTGWKLNRERIGVDLENRKTAPDIPVSSIPVPSDTIMKGLPLAGEKHPRQNDEPAKMVDPSYPDTDILNKVRAEQEAIEFDKAARREFIRELRENAAKAGYIVEIDREGNARFTKKYRKPSSSGQTIQDFDEMSPEPEE